MNDARSIRLHYGLRAILLLLFALYIGHLVQQDALHYYVAPKLAVWIRLCPVPLVLMSINLMVQALFGAGGSLCDCDHKLPQSLWHSAALYGLFIFPLLLGFLIPDRALGSAAAARKGLALTYSAAGGGPGLHSEHFSPADKKNAELAAALAGQSVVRVYPEVFSETFAVMDLYKSSFEGKEIIVSGFLYRDMTPVHGEIFAVSRFLVQCCTADAAPLGIMLDPGKQISLPADTWIEVRGKLHQVHYRGQEIMQITAESITKIPEPATPYIYTNPDSIAVWKGLQDQNHQLR